jgi:hypothetical protein
MAVKYFPQGIAIDRAFCNRVNERERLKKKITANEHTVLMAPRRYGKTSLIAQTLKENNFLAASIDFFFVLNQTEVTKHLFERVSELMLQLMPKGKAAAKKLLDSMQALNPRLSFSFFGQKLELSVGHYNEKSISDVLLVLDYLAQKSSQRCVLVFDEFQQIGSLKENHAIEAAIRHAVERSQAVSYVFCGSKRHLLSKMFSDKARPLYHLCDLMVIDRIDSSCYLSFLQQLAKKRWKNELSMDAFTEIVDLTGNHPYYVNALCRSLWDLDSPPGVALVRSAWKHYVEQQSPWIMTDLSGLTLNRRKVLQALALRPTAEPQSASFVERLSMGHASIKKAITALLDLDMLYRDKVGLYRVLDPAINYFIQTV